jgi:hypothetical protein
MIQISSEQLVAEILRLTNESRMAGMIAYLDKVRPKRIEEANAVGLEVRQKWIDSVRELTDYLALLTKNNPGIETRTLLARADVQDAIHRTMQEAVDFTMEKANAAWAEGQKLGIRDGKKLMNIAGLDPEDVTANLAHEYLASLQTDIERNADDVIRRVLDTFHSPTDASTTADELGVIARDYGKRGRAGANVARTKGYNDALSAVYGDGRPMVWITRFGANTCPTCAALHGTIVNNGTQFPSAVSFGKPGAVYFDLLTPPRHPNCHCILIPFDNSMLTETGPTPATLASYAIEYATEAASTAPAVWSEISSNAASTEL